MRFSIGIRNALWMAALCACATAQTTPAPPAANEAKGMPPRTAPSEYLSQGKAGSLAIGAEFAGHNVPTPQGPLTTEDYVVVEVGLFGAPDARARISAADFSLRVNGKKLLTPEPYGRVISNVKDPEWAPPEAEKKPKSVLNTGGIEGGGKDSADSLPPVVHIPIEVQRAMALRVQKATLPEGDRPLPVAGFIYFEYRGKEKGIRSLELVYSGTAGKAIIPLHP